jgi:hypothetical protein
MRRVASLEKVLERLSHLENALSNGNLPALNSAQVKSASTSKPIDLTDFVEPITEKKTLSVDFPLSEVPFPVVITENAPVATVVANEISANVKPAFEIPTAPPPENFPDFPPVSAVREPEFVSSAFLDSIPVRLPPISAEDLEHVEDNWLDSAFEDKLIREGEPLYLIPGASEIVQKILGTNGFSNSSPTFEPAVSNSSTAFAPARIAEKPKFTIPIFEPEEISDVMPVLPENPTPEDLHQYAENHPQVKLAMRIFRAKIVNVTQTAPNEKT